MNVLVIDAGGTRRPAKLVIEKGIIPQEEYMEKLSAERAVYQKLFNPTFQRSIGGD